MLKSSGKTNVDGKRINLLDDYKSEFEEYYGKIKNNDYISDNSNKRFSLREFLK